MRIDHSALADTILLITQGIENSKRPEDRVLAARYLSELAPILASAVLGQSILDRLDGIERLFGTTWLIDIAPFEAAFAKWRAFREVYEGQALAPMGATS